MKSKHLLNGCWIGVILVSLSTCTLLTLGLVTLMKSLVT